MPPKSIKWALVRVLEDLTKRDFESFCFMLVDRREEPRIRRYRVEGKNIFDVVDILVSTFTEKGALEVSEQILRQIDCNESAEVLVKEVTGS
ncbi:apoptosis-associated speck-like protein containing a CARD [Antennarius striatus]|uniref:apoptosis-associated speck-like protein containing a CARD n=1 Tax=Antennarius striatus TaxID=241820 RepID=UPI0035B3339B